MRPVGIRPSVRYGQAVRTAGPPSIASQDYECRNTEIKMDPDSTCGSSAAQHPGGELC